MEGKVLANNLYIVQGHTAVETALSAGNYPSSGSFVDVRGAERVHILADFGTINASDAPVLTVQEATAANGTPVDISGTEHTAANDDDGEMVSWTIETAKLTDGYGFITVDVAGVATGSYGTITFFVEKAEKPVTQATGTLPTASQYVVAG